jgi:hypothetical protein
VKGSETIGLRGLLGWVNRSVGAMLADFKIVDSGSLDVLLYCADDVAVSSRADVELEAPLR